MYGSDQSQAAALAATGTVLGVGWHFIAFGVLIMAGVTIITIASVLNHRARGDRR